MRIWTTVFVIMAGLVGFVCGFDLAYKKVVRLMDKPETPATVAADVGVRR